MSAVIDRVILSYPTYLSEAEVTTPTAGTAPSSWVQIAKTGSFVSQRYGQFSIEREDLAQMVHNFQNVTPKAPTRLPVDYDHLSMDPQRPGDGVAAGWIKELQLRQNGDELWALVEWTPEGSAAIRNKHYQFVSPSFVKNHIHKDGQTIGTTLLAAAITNHPFLEGMAALTLSAGIKELATPVDLADPADGSAPPAEGPTDPVTGPEEGVDVEVGQRVTVKDEEIQKPEQMGIVFTIAQVVGEGADAFVSLEAPDGTIAEWFRADELAPAPAAEPEPPAEPVPAAPPAMATPPPVAADPVHARRTATMSEYKLTDNTGKEITLSADVLQEIVAKAIPGQVLIKSSELDDLKGKVTTLNTQVDTMAKAAADAEQRAHTIELTTRLEKLSKGGFIRKDERDWAVEMWKDASDFAAFDKWAATKNTPIVKLNTEHGSGLDSATTPGDDAQERLISLAHKIQKEKRIPYSRALVEASRQDADAARSYQNHMRSRVQ
jgi:hypothetical protein